MNGEACGRSWCTVRHDPNPLAQRMHCAGVWRSSGRSNPVAVRVYPAPGRRPPTERPSVAVDIVAQLDDMWARKPRLPHGVGSWMDVDDVRALAYHRLDAAAWAEDLTTGVNV